jgi:PAS domain S-box-containing protein
MNNELSSVIDALPGLVWTALPDGHVDFVNRQWREYTGLSLEDSCQDGWHSAIHPEDLPQFLERLRSCFASGGVFEGEVRMRRFDGELRWFAVRSNPMTDASGAAVRCSFLNWDIEERKRGEKLLDEDIIERKRALETLQANQHLLDLAQRAARAMAFDWYIQRKINTWSQEQEALYGLAPGTFDGTYESWRKLVHPNDWPAIVASLKHAQQTGDISVEYRVVWPDGSIHWLAANGRMFFDDEGRPFRMVGFTADVTRRKSVEEELRRSTAFLTQAQHVSSTGSFWWRVSTTDEITWSEELYRIFEFDRATPITLERIRTRIHPEDLEAFGTTVDLARVTREDFEHHHRLLMPNQSIKYVHVVAQAYRDQNEQLAYIGAVQDVTERRVSEVALDKARSDLAHVARVMSLGALTASIAHEVNQPLSGIITNANTCMRMLDADPPNVDGARETARRTIRDGHRAADVITRLRALFSRKSAAAELVDLNEATREVIALSRSELERNRVIPRTEFAADLPLVTGDRVQLQQVILNLLRNGSDAMSSINDRPRELLFITEVEEGDFVRLSVKDAGTGFEPQAADRLFQPFNSTKDGGMGMGLSVSRSIIESHRGRLWAALNDGPGVTFSFSIPSVG